MDAGFTDFAEPCVFFSTPQNYLCMQRGSKSWVLVHWHAVLLSAASRSPQDQALALYIPTQSIKHNKNNDKLLIEQNGASTTQYLSPHN